MKKVIKLTESDLHNIVKKVLNEQVLQQLVKKFGSNVKAFKPEVDALAHQAGQVKNAGKTAAKDVDDYARIWNKPPGAMVHNQMSGKVISPNSFSNRLKDIDFTNILNAKNFDDYNKFIAQALKTNDFSKISRKGFEKFGIDDFRDFLKNNVEKIIEVNPATGRWKVKFKEVSYLGQKPQAGVTPKPSAKPSAGEYQSQVSQANARYGAGSN